MRIEDVRAHFMPTNKSRTARVATLPWLRVVRVDIGHDVLDYVHGGGCAYKYVVFGAFRHVKVNRR